MDCEVQQLEDNIRYRILIINGEQYILDMEQSFWQTIFPFFVWILPNTVFKIEDTSILEQLKEPNKEKVGGRGIMSLAGIGYFLGILLAPLMSYFEIPMSALTNGLLLIFGLILVAFLYLSMSHRRKKKLETVLNFDELSRRELWIRPSSKKQMFKLLALFLIFAALNVLFFATYVESRNIMMLLISSLFFFFYLLLSRITVEEGHTTVRFKDLKPAG